jgi:hypothetical protein
VLARCIGIDAAFAEESIRAVLLYRDQKGPIMTPQPPATERMSQADMDRLYDELAALVDRAPKDQRERVLARLAVALMQTLSSYDKAKKAIELAAV